MLPYGFYNCSIFLNDREVISDSFSVSPGKIKGLHFMFYGTGSVNSVSLKDSSGTIIYSDQFESELDGFAKP